jgi:hypothetical protein
MKPQEYEVTETTAKGWRMVCVTFGCLATGPLAGPGNLGREQAISKNEERSGV